MITQQKQQQQQQSEQEKKEILSLEKGLKATKKELLIPLSIKPEKNNEVLTPPTTPSPKLCGNT